MLLITRGLGPSQTLITQGLGGSGVTPPTPEIEAPATGGWLGYRRQSAEELREERERLGILPKQQAAITRTARRIAKRLEPAADLAAIQAEILRAEEFNLLLADISKRNRAIMEGFTQALAKSLEWRIMLEMEDEEEVIVRLWLEL